MLNFIKSLLSNNTQSSMRFCLLVGLLLTCIITGFILWLSVKYVSFGLDIQIIDKLTYLIGVILTILVVGKTTQKFAEVKEENK
jgi:hypothetical protein